MAFIETILHNLTKRQSGHKEMYQQSDSIAWKHCPVWGFWFKYVWLKYKAVSQLILTGLCRNKQKIWSILFLAQFLHQTDFVLCESWKTVNTVFQIVMNYSFPLYPTGILWSSIARPSNPELKQRGSRSGLCQHWFFPFGEKLCQKAKKEAREHEDRVCWN